MIFQKVKYSIIDLLGMAAEGRYQVFGYRSQSKSAEAISDSGAYVQVYYSTGDFRKEGGSESREKCHDMTFNVELNVSAKAEIDLELLSGDTATALQRQQAIIAMKTAAAAADEKMDNLIHVVWNILIDARNLDLGLKFGLTRGDVANNWIGRIQKDSINEKGDIVSMSAIMVYTLKCEESIQGDLGNPVNKASINSELDVNN